MTNNLHGCSVSQFSNSLNTFRNSKFSDIAELCGPKDGISRGADATGIVLTVEMQKYNAKRDSRKRTVFIIVK